VPVLLRACTVFGSRTLRSGSGDWVYAHRSDIEELVWENLVVGTRVEFRIGFNIRGATALELHIVGPSPQPRTGQLGLFKGTAVR